MGAISRSSAFRRTKPMRFWLVTAGALLATAATLYLGTMTVLWGLHVQELRADQSELVLRDAEQLATVDAQEADVRELHASLAGELRAVTDGAHDKALHQDLRYVYHDYALALKGCADERDEVLDVVRQRYLYITWTVHRYDDNVASYCKQLKKSWAETLAEEES